MASRKDIREDLRSLYGSMLTTAQVGQYLGCDPRTARKYIESHEIEPTRIGGREKFSVIDLAKCLAT